MQHLGHDSIRIEYGDGTKSREVLCADKEADDWMIDISPGQTINFTIWFKTAASTIGCTHEDSGIRLGVDFYYNNNGITGIQSPDGSYWTQQTGFPANQHENYLNYGNDWTQRSMVFTVPESYPSNGYGAYPNMQYVVPNHIIPWVQCWCDYHGNTDQANAWFADAVLYITETEGSTPVPTASPVYYSLPDSTSGLDSLIGIAAVFGVFILIIWPFVGDKVKERF